MQSIVDGTTTDVDEKQVAYFINLLLAKNQNILIFAYFLVRFFLYFGYEEWTHFF